MIDSENLAANDKKRQLEELQSKLKSLPEPVKFPANIDLVVKNYGKINAAMPPVHRTPGAIQRRPRARGKTPRAEEAARPLVTIVKVASRFFRREWGPAAS